MRPLSAPELLGVWERGMAQPAPQRALTLLAAACPDTSPDALAELSVGRRDARLLTLREWTFGPRLVSLAGCPACGERLELAFDVVDVRVTPSEEGEDGQQGSVAVEPLSLEADGYELSFRLPNSRDLAAIADREDMAASRRLLLGRCLLAVRKGDEEVSLDQLPDEVVAAVTEQMARADPQADVRLALSCPACHHRWEATFDIVSFFWREIDAWAYRVLREVHLLASAYGWREADILSLSPWRRQLYLEMIGG